MMFLMGGMQIYPSSDPVDLATGSHAIAQPGAMTEDAMHVCVTRDGQVYFRKSRIEVKSLPILIRGGVGEGAERKVYLSVDSRARYSNAAAVVDEIGKAGIRKICILMYKSEK